MLIGGLTTVLGVLLTPQLIGAFAVSDEVAAHGETYLRIAFLGTVPLLVMPVTVTVNVVAFTGATAADRVPPAVLPAKLMSPPVNEAGLTGSLNTTVNAIGPVFVGSGWPAAWLTVTVGATLS